MKRMVHHPMALFGVECPTTMNCEQHASNTKTNLQHPLWRCKASKPSGMISKANWPNCYWKNSHLISVVVPYQVEHSHQCLPISAKSKDKQVKMSHLRSWFHLFMQDVMRHMHVYNMHFSLTTPLTKNTKTTSTKRTIPELNSEPPNRHHRMVDHKSLGQT